MLERKIIIFLCQPTYSSELNIIEWGLHQIKIYKIAESMLKINIIYLR